MAFLFLLGPMSGLLVGLRGPRLLPTPLDEEEGRFSRLTEAAEALELRPLSLAFDSLARMAAEGPGGTSFGKLSLAALRVCWGRGEGMWDSRDRSGKKTVGRKHAYGLTHEPWILYAAESYARAAPSSLPKFPSSTLPPGT